MILIGDCIEQMKTLPAESVHMCVTSPPYWGLRDYGVARQLGLEKTPQEFVENMVGVFREVKRVLKNDGTLWLNLGDSYAGSWGNQSRKEHRGKQRAVTKEQIQDFRPYGNLEGATKTGSRERTPGLKPKDLVGIPWRVAFALQADGWYLRQDIIWHKPNPMPESVTDRCTKAHEYIFLLAKSPKYFFDHEAIKEASAHPHLAGKMQKVNYSDNTTLRNDGNRVVTRGPTRNKRSVWTVTTKPFRGAHFATFPQDLIEPCILAGSAPGNTVLDPFFGAGTTGLVAKKHGRNYIGIELNPEYAAIAAARIDAFQVQQELEPA